MCPTYVRTFLTIVNVPHSRRHEHMSWQPELDELRERERLARAMGGADKVKRQHDGGRLTVGERIERVLERGSFHEIGKIAGSAEYNADATLRAFTSRVIVPKMPRR